MTFFAGAAFVMTVTLTNKTTGAPELASAYEITAQVRKKLTGAEVASLLVEAGPATNKVKISAQNTENWPSGILVWNIKFKNKTTGYAEYTSIGEIMCEIPPTRI